MTGAHAVTSVRVTAGRGLSVPAGRWSVLVVAAVFGALAGFGCYQTMESKERPSARRDINAVLAEHDDRLLAIPGVVGICVGLLDDEKTPCLKLMLSRDDTQLKSSLPRVLEGYPVAVEVTGEIRPLGENEGR